MAEKEGSYCRIVTVSVESEMGLGTSVGVGVGDRNGLTTSPGHWPLQSGRLSVAMAVRGAVLLL